VSTGERICDISYHFFNARNYLNLGAVKGQDHQSLGICLSRDSEEDRSLLVVPGIQLNSLAVEGCLKNFLKKN
jgi:hypothetical protein